MRRVGPGAPAGAILRMVGRTAAFGLTKVAKVVKLAAASDKPTKLPAKQSGGGKSSSTPLGNRGRPQSGGSRASKSLEASPVRYSRPAFAGLFKDDPNLSQRVKDIARGRERGGA